MFSIFFDNAGGITLQTSTYCHHYLHPNQAAEDVIALLTQGVDTTEYWDGNEPEHRFNESQIEDLNCSDLVIYDQDSIKKIFYSENHPVTSSFGKSEEEFWAAMMFRKMEMDAEREREHQDMMHKQMIISNNWRMF